MRILHVIPSISLRRGGPSQAVVQMVKAQLEQGMEAEVVTTNDDMVDLLDVPLEQWTDYEGVRVYFVNRFSPPIAPLREFAYSKSFSSWFKFNARNYDVVHVHAVFSYLSTRAMQICRHLKVPYVVRTIGQLEPWALAQSKLRKQIYLWLIERRNINRAGFIHCTWDSEGKSVAELKFKAPIQVIPLGVWLPSRELLATRQDHDQGLRLAFLSRLHPKKNLDLVIRALALTTNTATRLVIAGEGDPAYLQELKALVAELNLQDRVEFVGLMLGTQKHAFLLAADIFILPSKSENFGIAVVEAMSYALPIIVSPDVAVSQAVEQYNAGMVTDANEFKIAEAINALVSQPSARKDAGENARAYVETHLSWSEIVKYIGLLYGKLSHH